MYANATKSIATFSLIAAALVTGCGLENDPAAPRSDSLPDDGRTPASLLPEELDIVRVSHETDAGTHRRNAVLLAGGETHTFHAEDVQTGDYVRLGLMATESAEGDFESVQVQWQDGRGEERVSEATGAWQDFRFTANPPAESQDGGTLTLFSSADFWLAYAEIVPHSRQSPPVIVVLVDTLRQDHVHCYGYERETSPNIDAFREDGVLFHHLVPPTSWTRPSVASLLTSAYPGTHGAQDRGDRVRKDVTWLADVLRRSGYESHAILTNPNCIRTWGFGDDFDRAFETSPSRWLNAETDSEAFALGMQVVEELQHRPYFLYLHALAPHEPYKPPHPFDSRFKDQDPARNPAQQLNVNLYDGEIAYVDSLFGEFIDKLKAEGVYDRSLLVLLSDHGEEFWDHGGTSHGKTLYEEQLRVPLLIKFPLNQHANTEWNGIVEMVDVAPTLLEILGVPAEPGFQGKSIAARIGSADAGKSLAYASLFLDDLSMRAVKSSAVKYIYDVVTDADTYFDLVADPLELSPLANPPANAAKFEEFAAKMASMGQSGLHVLITHDSKKTEQISGTLTSASLSGATLRYPKALSETNSESADVFQFSVVLPAADDPRVRSVRWQQAMEEDDFLRIYVAMSDEETLTEQNNAKLIADVGLTETIRLELTMDGKPFPRLNTHLGRLGEHGALDGTPIAVADVVASPYAFDPAALPIGTAVYVWYIPAPETIADGDLDPELRESLKALGYITE